jgi:hypothetical protein
VNERHEHLPKLTPEDERVLELLVDVGFEIDAVELTAEERQRAESLLSLLGLLNDYPLEEQLDDGDPVLVDATLARIDRHEDERSTRMSVEGSTRGVRRLRLPDFITVAAVLLIGASITLPMLNNLRQSRIDRGCENNLRVAHIGISNYAASYGDELPLAYAGASTWSPNDQNVLNLGPLVEGEFCKRGCLHCPGHPDEAAISYSYRWQPTGQRMRLTGGPGVTVILGDQNPLIEAMRTGRQLPLSTPSSNHAGRGQFTLSTDGTTAWSTEPILGRDNFWVPEEGLRKGARPKDPSDVFLAH